MVVTTDGSLTMYSAEYDECYHSVKEGAYTESIMKYVEPTFNLCEKEHIRILDICFGLGYNTLATIAYFKKQTKVKCIEIFSPELDANLIKSLSTFNYPNELNEYKYILDELIQTNSFKCNNITIDLFVGDALEYIPTLKNIDIVYQDAFSPIKNPLLWDTNYFKSLKNIMNKNGYLFSYSIARAVRDNLEMNEFEVEKVRMKNGRHMLVATI